jgi:shikimate kinase
VVWLDCSMERLLQRCVLMGDRPLFRNEASFRRLYEERLPYYQQADYRIESGGESLRVVEQILALGIFGHSARVLADGNSS